MKLTELQAEELIRRIDKLEPITIYATREEFEVVYIEIEELTLQIFVSYNLLEFTSGMSLINPPEVRYEVEGKTIEEVEIHKDEELVNPSGYGLKITSSLYDKINIKL